jgi:GNAT superfamily N-acetyltransferase
MPAIRIEPIDRKHAALSPFLENLPVDSGWPAGTVLSLTDREPTDFERAERYIAAFVDGRIVGAVSLHPEPPGNYHRLHNLHFHIDILPAWQGKGVGRALLARTLAIAREEGYWRVYLGTLSWNRRALSLFGAFGFRVEGVSRAAYRVKTEAGDEYYVDGIGMALWLGPALEPAAEGWRGAKTEAGAGGVEYSALDAPTVEELRALYRSVSDRRAEFPDLIKGAWSGAEAVVTAREDGELIGLARAISDGATTLFVCDLMVEPARQKRGIGAELMRRLVAPYEGIYQTVLLTDPETIPFYEKLGYLRWTSACLKMNPPEDAGA